MKVWLWACLAVVSVSSWTLAAEESPFPPPVKEHAWLKQFVGEWSTDMATIAGPGTPEMKCQGKITSREFGGFWVVSEMKSTMDGMPMQGLQTIGYDPTSKKYIGTWVDTMTAHMWKYEGSVDEGGKILTLEAEGPNFLLPGKTAMYRDIYEFKSKDEIAFSSQVQGDDGKWITFMHGTSRRTK